ncbi:TrbI/VirB10 family protein [Acinetobacter baumannii]|uniref:TrbI/VirB10 family protein n=1 Tax=Acinetobacter baumannii TaxID=470 RepID=UPI0034E28032
MSEKTPKNHGIEESPDFFASPKKGRGVRRLNRLPLMIIVGIVLLAVAGISYTFITRTQTANAPAKEAEQPPVQNAATPPVKPEGDVFEPPAPPTDESTQDQEEQPASTPTPQPAPEPQPSQAYMNRMRMIEQVEEHRITQLDAALNANGEVQSFKNRSGGDGSTGGTAQAGANGRVSGQELIRQYMENAGAGGQMAAGNGFMPQGGGGAGSGGGMAAANGQAQKRAFLAGTTEANTYLAHERKAAVAPNLEVKAGTVIPGVMISGINSDLPGQIIGQVRQAVYDSATGTNLLIPPGSRLVGTYDSSVTLGQTRALVAWQRLIYPDGSSLSLDNMPGTDMGGYAGYKDKVNNHYVKLFGSALFLSAFSAGVQLSQPQATNGENYNSSQIIAGALGQQLGQLGMSMAQRNMDIQPTIEIRPGYQFNVMVTKDIILPPWEGHPLAKH